MNILTTSLSVLKALWQHDYVVLSDPRYIWTLYFILFLILVFENGFLPAAFLPGDSLLILAGVLISNSSVATVWPIMLFILILGSGIGSWIGYVQGRWLSNRAFFKSWLSNLPEKYHHKTYELFYRHGLVALFLGRFIAFVRTLLPIFAGLSGLNTLRFQLYNWLSAVFWVVILVGFGYLLGTLPFFKENKDLLTQIMLIIPLFMFIFGIILSIFTIIYQRKQRKKTDL